MAHARFDGSLPPSPRWLRDDAYGQVRLHARIHPIERQRLDDRRQQLVDALDKLDTELTDWLTRRRRILAEARMLHDRLWPSFPNRRVDRPPSPDTWPLPPEAQHPYPLRGLVLRRWCLAILRRHGPCRLRELRALVNLYGCAVEGDNVPKVLSDALRREVTLGRAVRIERGTYAASVGQPRRPTDPILGEAPPDWYPIYTATSANDYHEIIGIYSDVMGHVT